MPKKPKKNKNIKKSGKRNKRTAALAYKGEISRVMRTHGFIKESESENEYFVSGRDLLGAIPGDIILFEKTGKRRDSESLPEAKVVRIVKSANRLLTGTVVDSDGEMCLVSDSFGSRFPLEIGAWNGHKLKAGDKVSFSLKSRGAKHHLHIADIEGVYGSSQKARVCVEAYLEEKRIPVEFPEEAEEEAADCGETIDISEIPNRLDLRESPIFTIDGSDTKDIDDAIGIERTKDGYRLGVHIADVSHYVREKSALDEEAFERGTSVYIADLVVPMLPKALSNGICSLNPNVDRLSFSCLMDVAKSGEVKAFEFKKTVIRSRIQGVYSEINDILKNSDKSEFNQKYSDAGVLEQLPLMFELAETFKKNREGRNAPSLESAESKIICGENGECLDIKRRESGENAVSEGIIEEFMLLANNCAAKLAMEKDFPFVYRIHEPPPAEKLTRLSETLAGLGIQVGELKPTAESLSGVLRAAAESAAESGNSDRFDVVNMAVLRSMMKAKYSDEPLGHFGLVMGEYAHFTSPIRRYPDLSIHRILSAYAAGVENGGIESKLKKRYGKFAHESSLRSTFTELRAVNAERDCVEFYAAEYMSSRIGEEFDGVIAGVTDMSVFVMLENTVQGRVSFRNTGGTGTDVAGLLESAGYESDGVSLSNAVTGVRYTLGDRVRVKCVSCSVPLGLVDFELV